MQSGEGAIRDVALKSLEILQEGGGSQGGSHFCIALEAHPHLSTSRRCVAITKGYTVVVISTSGKQKLSKKKKKSPPLFLPRDNYYEGFGMYLSRHKSEVIASMLFWDLLLAFKI